MSKRSFTSGVRWWTFRRAVNRKPSTYTCPLCGGKLLAMTEHMLLTPEGDASRRRHAHTSCAAAARKAGRLPTKREWQKSRPADDTAMTGALKRVLGWLRGRSA